MSICYRSFLQLVSALAFHGWHVIRCGMTVNIIIDANIILHYRRIDEIDWPGLVRSSPCNIVIVPALMTELERKKATASSPVIRKRAGKAIEFLVRKMDETDPIALRPSCTLVFHDNEPTIDFAANRLSPDVDDDRYIASSLEIAAETNSSTYIASGDGGLKLKLRSRPVNILTLPDELRLADEIDPETQELRKAKQELEEIKTARPKPVVGFNGAEKLRLEFPDLIIPKLPTLEQEKRKFPLKEPSPPKPQVVNAFPKLASGIDIANLSGLSGLSLDRQNEARLRYYAAYEQYLADMEHYLDRICRIEEVEFYLWNDGLVAAHNIEVTIRAPEGTRWISRRDLPKAPKKPEAPGTTSSWLGPNISPLASLHHDIPHFYDGSVSISESGQEVSSSCKVLKPKCGLTLDKATIEVLDRRLIGGSKRFMASLSYSEGVPIEFELPFELASIGTIDHTSSG